MELKGDGVFTANLIKKPQCWLDKCFANKVKNAVEAIFVVVDNIRYNFWYMKELGCTMLLKASVSALSKEGDQDVNNILIDGW